MATINKLMVGESLVGEGNEVAHIDLIMGPRGSAAEMAFANALTNNKDGFTALLAVVAPNLPVKPNTILFNKVTIKDAKQAVQMFGPAQYAVAKAVADAVAEGTIPAAEADDVFICVGVFLLTIEMMFFDEKKKSAEPPPAPAATPPPTIEPPAPAGPVAGAGPVVEGK